MCVCSLLFNQSVENLAFLLTGLRPGVYTFQVAALITPNTNLKDIQVVVLPIITHCTHVQIHGIMAGDTFTCTQDTTVKPVLKTTAMADHLS